MSVRRKKYLVIISNEILYDNFPGYYPIELEIYLDLKFKMGLLENKKKRSDAIP